MDASKVRGKNEIRVSTTYPNEVEEMLECLPNCAVSEYAQVWNNKGEWMFWVRTPNEDVARELKRFLSEVDLSYDGDTQS